MRVLEYIYDSESAEPHVESVLEALAARDEDPSVTDLAAVDDRKDGLRNAMLTVRESVRIGSTPEELYDDSGEPDFSAGVLVTEEATGRRHLHVGAAALEALSSDR